ncbi:hypothetical protein [Streptomyces spinoverrucosus]|uniref:hypothetical protein n=1 Tax=Streptomyces spinoverrucosus TaxID=284043 RepID=UPI001144CD2E|nr:hypothetical protein [Streptomyces spinoverrucosus]
MRNLIEPGRCTACLAPAERGPSRAWWHERGASCGRNDVRFEAVRQQPPPRNRQINHPGRDR